jgi:hypothetical protein
MIPPLTLTIDFSDRVVSVLEMLCGRTLTTRTVALATTSIPRSAPPAIPPSSWRNPDVDAVLTRMFPSSNPFFTTAEILAELTKVAKNPLPKWSTISVACIQRLHIKRGTPPVKPKAPRSTVPMRGVPRVRAVPLAEPLVTPHGAPGVALPPVEADWHRIQSQALREGYTLRSNADLPSYNRARIQRGDAPFAIRALRRRAA